MSFHEAYRPAIRCGLGWALVLALVCSMILDGGASTSLYLCALGGYLSTILLVMLRRPANPSPLDLVVVGWMLPATFFPLLFLLPLIAQAASNR